MATQQLHSMQWSLYPSDSDQHFSYEVPWWGRLVLLFDMTLFLPLIIILNYTLPHVYPVFAIVAERKPSKYSPINPDDFATELPGGPQSIDDQKHIKTSSLSAIYRVLVDNGGFLANFRGLSFALIQSTLTGLLVTRFLSREYESLARLIPALVLVQFSTLWLYVIVAEPTNRPFWNRVPPFKRTFNATWQATVLHWAAVEVTRWLPHVTAFLLDVDWPAPRFWRPDNTYSFRLDLATGDVVFYLKCAFIVLISVIGSIFLVVPSQMVLIRIQTSLLPIEEETVVPFDRSFRGKVSPEVKGGRGYATISDAWSTFSLANWSCLVILSIKIILLSLFGFVLMCAFVCLQWMTIVTRSTEPNAFL